MTRPRLIRRLVLAGDDVLMRLVSTPRTKLRREDSFARYSGDEFGVLLPELDVAGAVKLAEKVRNLVEKHCFEQEWLLGFDARELWLDVEREWGASRRGLYLLREDVRKPLAVDTTVWPSAFEEGLLGNGGERLELREVSGWGWRGPNAPLWDDLERMRGCLASLGAVREAPHALIAVSWFWDGRPPEGSWLGVPYRERMVPPSREEGWSFLGFDIADGGFISGLTNCGYTGDDTPELRGRWAGHLNEHHLLEDLEQALAFRDLSDLRVPEHAPFFVFGLWLIDAGTECFTP